MFELRQDQLIVHDPDVHPDARARLEFQRTLRIPDDDRSYPLPAGLGPFPLRHVDDHADTAPEAWRRHGGIMLPMYQSEAMWLNFVGGDYPYAMKVAAGKVCAITGEPFTNELHGGRGGEQDYLVVPAQRWLDGFAVDKGFIRQFVAMPLGSGYSAEEQLTGEAEWGGLQVVAYPMKAERWERLQTPPPLAGVRASASAPMPMPAASAPDMGLAPGGRMRQVIHRDPHGLDAWDTSARSRCYVHLCNSLVWRAVTGAEPPTTPPTAEEYRRAGLPWFSLYEENAHAAGGGSFLGRLKSVATLGKDKGDVPLPDNTSVTPTPVVSLAPGQVREGEF